MHLPRLTLRTRVGLLALLTGLQTAILLGSLAIDAASNTASRGLITPPLFLISVAAAYFLGLRYGGALALYTALVAWRVYDLSVFSPVLWVILVLPAGWLGDRIRHANHARAEAERQFERLQWTLRQGLQPAPDRLTLRTTHVAAVYRPATSPLMLGGDFYGIVERHDSTFIVVGDVSGHGPEAAAIGVQLRACWRALVEGDVDPDVFGRAMNRILLDRPGNEFATVVALRIYPAERRVRVLNAGHPSPLLITDDTVESLPSGLAPPFGVVEHAKFPTTELSLPDGLWSIVAYTDGLVEGRGEHRDAFPTSELAGLLLLLGPPLDDGKLQRVLREADAQSGDTLGDDVVLVAVSPSLSRSLSPPSGSRTR